LAQYQGMWCLEGVSDGLRVNSAQSQGVLGLGWGSEWVKGIFYSDSRMRHLGWGFRWVTKSILFRTNV
jgi:hypothetical protein